MGRISTATIDEINARADIVNLVGEYVRLEKRGTDYWGCCPFHNEKTPSFHVVPDRKMYHCFGCGQGGGVINFFMEMEKIPFSEAVLQLAKKYAVEVVYEYGSSPEAADDFAEKNKLKEDLLDLYKRVAGMYHFFLTSTNQGKAAFEYLQKRGVTSEIAEQFCLGYAPNDRRWLKKFLSEKNYSEEFLSESGLFSKKYPDVSFFSDRLMFPICNRKGQVVAFGGRILNGEGPKYLNSGDLPLYKKGETLYAFQFAKNEIRTKKAVILCEGYMDVIAYHQAGLSYAVAPLGTALTEEQIRVLRPFVETFYLSFDSDEAGQKATYRAIIMCREAGASVRIIQIKVPPSVLIEEKMPPKDPADVLLNFGVDILTNIVDNSIIDADYLLSILSEKYPVDTPEGKTQAALSFFPYIDALQSDIQKESCFEQLCRTFGLEPRAVRSDFNHRDIARKRTENRSKTVLSNTAQINIKKNAELRAMLAVAANTKYFADMRTMLTPDDFEDSTAKELFYILEECFREDAVSYDAILSKCSDENLRKVISETIISKEFAENSQKTIEDSIKLIKRSSLERKRMRLVNKIRQWQGTTLEDLQELQNMQLEKMTIDNELNIKDANE